MCEQRQSARGRARGMERKKMSVAGAIQTNYLQRVIRLYPRSKMLSTQYSAHTEQAHTCDHRAFSLSICSSGSP